MVTACLFSQQPINLTVTNDVQNFVHLHTHSDASLDGLGQVKNLVHHAKELGFSQLALTDHGTLANVVQFVNACEYEGIKPVVGCESYISLDTTRCHITLLAHGDIGWSNLVKLQNLAHRQSDNRRATFTVDQLIEYQKGLVVLTGCQMSPFHVLPEREALMLGAKLKSVFGNRLFAELMTVTDDTAIIERTLKLAYDLGLVIVATNDVHFPSAELAPVHKLLTRIKSAYDYDSAELYMKTTDQMYERAKALGIEQQIGEGMVNAYRVASSLAVPTIKHKETLPVIIDSDKRLWELLSVHSNPIIKSNPDLYHNEQYVERIAYEMDIFHKRGSESYLVILDDILRNGVNGAASKYLARGSGCGSLVLFLLGFTQIDPIVYGLDFERFLNPERKGLPDIDMDLSNEARELFVDYAHKHYNGIPVATYSHYSNKTATHALSRVLKIPRQFDEDIADKGQFSEYWQYVSDHWPDFPLALETLIGQIENIGSHAAGVVLEVPDLIYPIERNKKGDQLQVAFAESSTGTQDASQVGLVKYDGLGSDALDFLMYLEKLTGQQAPLYHLTTDSDKQLIYELFVNGNTKGIHQFTGSPGIRRLTRDVLEQTGFNDGLFDILTLCNAAYRPAAMDKIAKLAYYAANPVSNPPIIADVLAPTFGLMIYQEQMMKVYARIVGGGLGAADLARRLIVKNKPHDPSWRQEFEVMQAKFLQGCRDNSIDTETAHRLWADIVQSTGYGFNLSHAVDYTILAWQMAWYKVKYPVYFYTEVCNSDEKDVYEYLLEASALGIEIKPPHVNVSDIRYKTDGKAIYIPLTQIHGLGGVAVSAIIDERSAHGLFTSLGQMHQRIPARALRKNQLLALHEVGAVSGLDHDLDVDPIAMQKKHLEFVLPTPEIHATINGYRAQGYMAGIVVGSAIKEGKWGEYRRYRIYPNQWANASMKLPEYQFGELLVAVANEKGSIQRLIT